MGFPGGSVLKNPPAMQDAQVQFLGEEGPPGGEHGNPLQDSCLGNPIDRGAQWATVHGVRRIYIGQYQQQMFVKLEHWNWKLDLSDPKNNDLSIILGCP